MKKVFGICYAEMQKAGMMHLSKQMKKKLCISVYIHMIETKGNTEHFQILASCVSDIRLCERPGAFAH